MEGYTLIRACGVKHYLAPITQEAKNKLIKLSEFKRMTRTCDLFLSQLHVNEFRVSFMAYVLLFQGVD